MHLVLEPFELGADFPQFVRKVRRVLRRAFFMAMEFPLQLLGMPSDFASQLGPAGGMQVLDGHAQMLVVPSEFLAVRLVPLVVRRMVFRRMMRRVRVMAAGALQLLFQLVHLPPSPLGFLLAAGFPQFPDFISGIQQSLFEPLPLGGFPFSLVPFPFPLPLPLPLQIFGPPSQLMRFQPQPARLVAVAGTR